MTVHRVRTDDDGDAILKDDCERCDELAEDLRNLDNSNWHKLWNMMLRWNDFLDDGGRNPITKAEAKACDAMHRIAMLLERHSGIRVWLPMPWVATEEPTHVIPEGEKCTCGCGATSAPKGLCECGAPVGHP